MRVERSASDRIGVHGLVATVEEAKRAVLTLLARRARQATVCPSEAARALDPEDWRDAMPIVHAAVDAMRAENRISLSWKGKAIDTRDGPYRIGRVMPG